MLPQLGLLPPLGHKKAIGTLGYPIASKLEDQLHLYIQVSTHIGLYNIDAGKVRKYQLCTIYIYFTSVKGVRQGMIINCLVSKQASLITCIVTKQTSSLVFHPLKIIAQTYIIHLCRENILFSVSFPSYCLVPHFKYVCLFVSRRVLPDRHVRICRDPQGCNSPL